MWSVSWGGWRVKGLSSIWFSLVSLPWRKKREKTHTQVIRHCNEIQWRIQGRGPGSPSPLPPPLIFRPNWGPKGRKNSFGDRAAPFLRVWMTGAPFISRSRSGTDLFPSCERIVILPILYVSTCSFVSFVSSLYLEFTVCLLHARDFNSVRDCTWCNRVLASPRVNENFQTKLSIYYKLATVLFGIRYTYWNLV